jgi:hypothetical protein
MNFKLLTGLVMLLLISCNNTNSETEQKTDSIAKKFDSFATKTWDSTKAKARDLKDKVEGALDKDSAN